ncbi:MAG: hypothetical protein SFT94_04145 [Pseudanabaenaceae cyanobacterium bins.68]|nr:hypothetical protein [Pseudanabaenaceae cyanobacterium bins.68]
MGRLFSPSLLTKQMDSFGFPPDLENRHRQICQWFERLAQSSEPTTTRAEFIHSIFVDLLGYSSPFGDRPELEFMPETALGFFEAELLVVTQILWQGELMGLERAPWLIVISDRDFCLYSGKRDLLSFERFEFAAIADLEVFRRFYFLCCRRVMLPQNPTVASRLEQILHQSQTLELEQCEEFYSQYHRIRWQLIKDFRYRLKDQDNGQGLAIAAAQKLLDRICLIAYGESSGWLPKGMLRQAYEFENPYRAQPVWENYLAIFGWLRQGHRDFAAANLEMFEFDPLLDQLLFVGEELCRQIKELTRFELAHEFSASAIAELLAQMRKDLPQPDQEPPAKEKRVKFKISQRFQSDRYRLQLQIYTWIKAQIPEPELALELQQLRILIAKSLSGLEIADAWQILLEFQCGDRNNSSPENLSQQIYTQEADPYALRISQLHFGLRSLGCCGRPLQFQVGQEVDLADGKVWLQI